MCALQVNGRRLLGLNHVDVVSILKELPQHVRIVCCREKAKPPQADLSYAQTRDQLFQSPNTTPAAAAASMQYFPSGFGDSTVNESGASSVQAATPSPYVGGVSIASHGLTDASSASPFTPGSASYQLQQSERLVKAKSEQSLPVTSGGATPTLMEQNLKSKSRSLEPLTGLAMWSPELVEVHLQKGERGLGFSILDYQVRIHLHLRRTGLHCYCSCQIWTTFNSSIAGSD